MRKANLLTHGARLLVFAFILAGCGSRPERLPDGTTSSGGGAGDGLAAELLDLARNLVREMNDRLVANPFPVERSRSLLERLKVESTDRLLLKDGAEVDALNFPAEARILVQRRRYQQMNGIQKERVVLHELFGLLDIDDRGYRASEQVLRSLGRLGLPPHPVPAFSDIACACDRFNDLRCTAGAAGSERRILGPTGPTAELRMRDADSCQRMRGIIRIAGRVCDHWNTLYRVDLVNFRFVEELSGLGSSEEQCLRNALPPARRR